MKRHVSKGCATVVVVALVSLIPQLAFAHDKA